MKKTVSFILLMMLFGILFYHNGFAYVETYPVGKNYLALSNLIENKGRPNTFHTKEGFKVNRDSVYTIVMSKSFLMDLYNNIESHEIDLYDNIFGVQSLQYIKDDINERVYVEFIASDDYIEIEALHMPASHLITNYEIIMYEGSYNDFEYFEPYIDQNEDIKYYGRLNINYDEMLSIETIKSFITAKDPLGQTISTEIINDNFTLSDKYPGTYEIVFETEYNQIFKHYFLTVLVEDLTAPSIYIDEPIQIELASKVDINTVLSYIHVDDNVDVMSYQDLVVVSDNYSAANTIGTYQIQVEATDQSSNKTTKTFNIELVDTNAPTITGPSQLYLYITDSVLTNEEILSHYIFEDDVLLDQTSITISFDDYMQKTTPGIYKMTIEVSDVSLNKTMKDIYIHVIDNRGPEFNVNPEYIISVSPTQLKSESDIITWLSSTLESEGVVATHIQIDYNEYTARSEQEGQYYVYLSYQVDDETYQTRIMMDVIDEQSNQFNLLYLLTLIPIGILTAYIIYRKRK